MPLTKKGSKIMSAMKDQYGAEKGKRVFYASKNKGTIKDVEKKKHDMAHRLSPKESAAKIKRMEESAARLRPFLRPKNPNYGI